ncbi:hypothetical protein M758_7G177900 [Ceratodon purpureus]|nr:hypothetical protein M758_7G177900 [Ceratodon purpureus]
MEECPVQMDLAKLGANEMAGCWVAQERASQIGPSPPPPPMHHYFPSSAHIYRSPLPPLSPSYISPRFPSTLPRFCHFPHFIRSVNFFILLHHETHLNSSRFRVGDSAC